MGRLEALILVVGLGLLVGFPVESARAWALYPLQSDAVEVSSSTPSSDVDALSDDSLTTGWRPTADDAAPWLEFHFDHPVQPAYFVFESLSAEGMGFVEEITVTSDTGTREVLRMSDADGVVPAVHWSTVGGVRSLRVEVTGCEGGAVGLSELVVVGRRPQDPDALTLDDLGRCSLVLERDLLLPAQRPSTDPIDVVLFTQRKGFFPWSLQMRGRDRSTDDRTVRAGKNFEVTGVMQTPSALVLRCADGTAFGLFDESDGAPVSIMSITRQFTVDELNDVFAGIVRFENARRPAASEY